MSEVLEFVKPIRIMHVVRTLATGGTETVVRKLVSSLDPDRFEQSVCTFVVAPGVQPPRTICLGLRPDRASFLIPQLTRLFRRERPDIVHSRNWATIEAVLAAKLAGIAGIVHSEHGRDVHTMGPQPMRRRIMRRVSYACADRVFCVSKELRQHYCQQLAMKSSAFDVIPNGVDIERFCPNPQARVEVRARLGVDPNTLVVGTVGRLDPVKDHITLVRATDAALAKGINLRLVIVGEGPQRRILENALSLRPTLSQRTVLAGEVNNVADWLNAFDIFVLPSISEGMSNTLLEAMAVGVAPIATAVGGNIEIVEDEISGLLVRPGDIEEIGSLLAQLAGNEERRYSLGKNARERVVSHFSMDKALKRYEELYSGLIKPKGARLPNPDLPNRSSAQTDSYVRNLRNL